MTGLAGIRVWQSGYFGGVDRTRIAHVTGDSHDHGGTDRLADVAGDVVGHLGPAGFSRHCVSILTRQARHRAARRRSRRRFRRPGMCVRGAGFATRCTRFCLFGSDRVGAPPIKFMGRLHTGSVGNGKVHRCSPVPAGPVAVGRGDSAAANNIPTATLHRGRGGKSLHRLQCGGRGLAHPLSGRGICGVRRDVMDVYRNWDLDCIGGWQGIRS